MKKLYMILTAMTLLSMSLNAQSTATQKVAQRSAPTVNSGINKAPNRATINVTDHITASALTATNTTYRDFSGVTFTSDAVYAGNSARTNAGYIQLRATNPSGIVTTVSGGKVKSITITVANGNNTVVVYGKNTAYTSGADLYSNATRGTQLGTLTSTGTITVSGDYQYIGIRSNRNTIYLSSIDVVWEKEVQVHDLAIALSAPLLAGAGNDITLSATVTNNGDLAENGYTVTFTEGNNVISTQTATESLAPGATATFTYDYATTSAQAGTTINFGASVACTNDDEAANNNATASTNVITLPPPENVEATAGNNQTATVTWDAPSNIPIDVTITESVTEGFDDTSVFESFSVGGITATQHTGAIGGWTLYDSTGEVVWPSGDADWTHEGDPQAWQVFNGAIVNETAQNQYPTAHSGDQYMESICPLNADIASDSWLISPELSGNAQTISFYESVISAEYAETYQVLYSTTDNNPSNFTLSQQFTTSATTWTKRTISLPPGTKYFAIRAISQDQWGMMIDDVTYEASLTETITPASYNVYLDGVLVGNVPSTTFSYTFNNVSEGEHECAVSAVYDAGESELVPATFSTQTKTDPPTITYNSDGAYYYITATAPTSDPDAEVTMTVGGQTATGTGSVTIAVGRGETDQTVTATATAQADGKAVSDPTTQTINVEASPLDPTPTPSISSQVLDASVEVTGSGQGEVHMYIDGVEVTNPAYVERTEQEYTVTVAVTAQITDGEHSVSTYTTTVVIPPINFNPDDEGWTQLPGTYTNDQVIDWGDNLMFVDRFSESTAQNNHPLQYVYKMTEDEGKFTERRTTNEHTIPVQHTGSKVFGYYTEEDVLADRDRQHVDTCVINANVQMTLEQNTMIYYYTLDRSRNSIQDESFLELSYLQNDGARYVEMDNFFTLHEPFQFGTMHRFDSINTVLPASAPQGVNGKHYGKYGEDYMAYVPIVWTHGNEPGNTRLNWDNDGLNNSYGSPIWRTSVGKVNLVSAQLERQVGKQGTANWDVINGTDTTKCSLFMIKSLVANGLLPDTTKSNIDYEPYMFRVWVTSPTGKLRNFKKVTTENWSGYEDDGPIAANTAYWLWDQLVYEDPMSDVISFPNGNDLLTQFTFMKQEQWQDTEQEEDDWALPEDVNMIFAAPDDLTADDIKIIVRFYYRSTGYAMNQQMNGMFLMGNRDAGDEYYGVEEPGGDPDPEIPTYIKNIYVIPQSHGEVVGVTYYNISGAQSSTPFDGINIVVTRYSDGTTTSRKVIR